jgi:hypothetical protein
MKTIEVGEQRCLLNPSRLSFTSKLYLNSLSLRLVCRDGCPISMVIFLVDVWYIQENFTKSASNKDKITNVHAK